MVASSTLAATVLASTRRRFTPPASATAMTLSARPSTRMQTVSKNSSWTISTPFSRSPSARMAATRLTRSAIRASPSGPWWMAYIDAITASSTCEVQMLEVAFSRRMCCSRV